ncbi:MAG: GTP-binding protein [Candidatus Lokiarchaeota archaeon]|nr:GTP-binding protein [Candidatus Lokiarchaeota archaeon]
MLRAVKIYIQGELIYDQNYGKSLDEESFDGILRNIMKDAFRYPLEEIKYHDFYKYRITYLPISDQYLLFLFISDLSDKFENIEKEIARCKKEFLSMFAGVLGHNIDPKTFAIFDPTVETIHKSLRPKISLVGFSGVGKTTITRLIRAEEIPTKHIPTITGDIATIKIGNLHFHLWDFAGQEQFSFLWNNFVHGSDAVLIITDSTLENVEKSKFFTELIRKEAPFAHQAVIGNKQDLPNALPISDLERMLNVKAYSMVATDPTNRDKMITIIADILEMSAEVSPLLKPLIDRDKKLAAAEYALENGDFEQAVTIFMDVADLCLTLGDDVVSQEFQEKALKIQNILKNVEKETITVSSTQIETNSDIFPPVIEVSSEPGEEQIKEEIPARDTLPSSIKSTINKIPPQIPPKTASIPQGTKPKPSSNLDQLDMMLKGLNSSSVLPKPKIKKPVAKPPIPPTDHSPDLTLSSNSKENTHTDASISVPPSVSNDPQAPPKPIPPPNLRPSIQKLKSSPPLPNTPTTVEKTSEISSDQSLRQRINEIGMQIMDLKLRLTDISKHIIDLDMENILGTISNEEFEQKQKKLEELEPSIKSQIENLEQLQEQLKEELKNRSEKE